MSKSHLRKDVSGLTALTMVIGTVIGAGVFFKPTAVFGAAGAPGLGLLAWILGGMIAIAGGLTIAEIGTIYPETGGLMVYLEKIYGKFIGFLVGWAQFIVYFPANIAALSIIFATQAISLLGMSDQWLIPIALLIATIVMGLNFLGTKYGGAVQTVSTILKLVPLAVIIIGGFLSDHASSVRLLPLSVESHPVVTGLGSALVATIFAYDGWMNVGALAGEMKSPEKVLPKVIVGGLSVVISVYVMINVAYLFAMSAPELSQTATPASDVAQILFSGLGGKLVTIGILISVFGGINGYTMAGIRIPYAMGLNGLLPFSSWFTKLGEKSKMPVNGGLIMLGISLMMICSGQFNQLTDMLIFVIWLFNILAFIGVFILRKTKPDMKRAYHVPLYPVVPLVAVLGGCYIVLNTLWTQPLNALLGVCLTLLGVPIYFWAKKMNE
ncbi:APC family permease [Isobaculum melis]|uniref:Serine/threonine exchange transporter, LAT family n=1 Tax=Isobaculum melis TaxID=142588 RepID=A0A1H9RI75_9LACT|nr:amino acid permease [Isobaculum melis]SER72422.1 serine/threonine exchange transporter, LAT family [Isobaculum melis]